MAKTESTAVNELIDLVHNHKPLPMGEPGGELFAAPAPQQRASSPRTASGTMHPPRMTSTIPPMRGAGEVAPLPRARAPQSTAEQVRPQFNDPRVRMGTASPSRGTTIPPLPRSTTAGTLPPPTAPIAAPFEMKPAESLVAQLSSASLPLPKQELLFDPDATVLGTFEDSKRADRIALAKKLVVPAIACIAAGIGLGFYVSANRARPAKATPATSQIAPAPTQTPSAPPTETVLHPAPRSSESANAATASAGGEQPQPPTKEEQAAAMAAAAAGETGSLTSDAPAERLRDVQAAKGTIALTDVRIDTEPQGASIILIDRGKQFPLGSTPLSTSLDPSRQYEVIIELAGRTAQTIKLDPATTSRLDISLGKKQRAAEKAAIQEPATPSKVDTADKPARSEPPKAAVKDRSDKAGAAAATTEVGLLMVSSKPPCEIHIDGVATGLTTPQRAIELAPGKHKVTFINADANLKKTFSVTIKAGEPTKLIQDFLAQ